MDPHLRRKMRGEVDLTGPSRAEAWASSGRAFGQDATTFEDGERPSWASQAEAFFGGKMEAAVPGKKETKEEKRSAIEQLANAPEEYKHEYKEMSENVYGKEPAIPKLTEDQIEALGDMKAQMERMVDVAPGLRKRIIGRVPSEQKGRPTTGCTVTIHYVAWLFPDAGVGPFQSSREVIKQTGGTVMEQMITSEKPSGPYTFVLGGGDVIDAWETAVPTMLTGETAEFVAGPDLAYGEEGAPHIGVPPNFPIKYEIELLGWEAPRKPRDGMPAAERLAEATKLKERGTEKFKRHKFREAMVFYDQATHYLTDCFDFVEDKSAVSVPAGGMAQHQHRTLEDGPPPPPVFAPGEEEATARALLLSCFLNGAQMGVRMENWRECEKRADKAIGVDRKSAKAWYRRGLAYAKVGEYGDAKRDLRRACEIDPKSREIRDAFDECKMAEADARQESKDFYSSTKVASGGYVAPDPEDEKDPLEREFVC